MDLVVKYNSGQERFHKLPIRIFLDTNIVQYLGDFGEFIYEGYLENDELLTPRGKKLVKGSFLHNEILSLREIFSTIERSPFHFAISEYIFLEVEKKNDKYLTNWFSDLWNYWQTVILESGQNAFSGIGQYNLKKVQADRSLISALSKSDFKVFCDAIALECDAILTCDKYRNRQNWIYDKYGLMILYPSDFSKLVKDFQPLWY